MYSGVVSKVCCGMCSGKAARGEHVVGSLDAVSSEAAVSSACGGEAAVSSVCGDLIHVPPFCQTSVRLRPGRFGKGDMRPSI